MSATTTVYFFSLSNALSRPDSVVSVTVRTRFFACSSSSANAAMVVVFCGADGGGGRVSGGAHAFMSEAR